MSSGEENVAQTFWHGIGVQLGNPVGIGGRLIGHFMRLVNHETNKIAITKLGIRPDDVVLELGCGPGHGVKQAARAARAGMVYGIDRSEVMLEQARWRNRKGIRQGRVVLLNGSFDNLPFESGVIDRMLAVNVIYFWHDLPAIASEIRRVLKVGGTLSIYASDEKSMRNWKFARSGTHRLFGATDLKNTLLTQGFEDFDIRVSPVKIAHMIDGLSAELIKRA